MREPWDDHQILLLTCVHGLLRTARRCKHKLRIKEAPGTAFVCENVAVYREPTADPDASVFYCRSCSAFTKHDNASLLPSPYIDEMRRLLQASYEWQGGFDNDLYYASVSLLKKCKHTFDDCDTCRWFPLGLSAPLALAELATAVDAFASTENFEKPDIPFTKQCYEIAAGLLAFDVRVGKS